MMERYTPEPLLTPREMAALLLQMAAQLVQQASKTPHVPDQLLTAGEAAALMGTTTKWMYNHAHELPFVVRLSPKKLRFSQQGLQRYLDGQQGTR